MSNYAVVSVFEESLESQNDNLGHDIAPMDGLPTFRKIMIECVSYLDTDTDNPVYGVNWGTFKPFIKTGWNFKESPAMRIPEKHTCIAVHTDLSYNFVCYDRRQNYVLHYVAA